MSDIPNVSIQYTIEFEDILKEIKSQLTNDMEKINDLPDRINFVLGYCDNETLQTEEAILMISKLQNSRKLLQHLERRFSDYENILASYTKTKEQVTKFGTSSLLSPGKATIEENDD